MIWFISFLVALPIVIWLACLTDKFIEGDWL